MMVLVGFPRSFRPASRVSCWAVLNAGARRVGIAAFVLASVLPSNQSAQASPITYTETLTATGMIGGQAFTDAVLTFTTVADTANVTLQTIDGIPTYENPGTTTVEIAGIGTATFTGGDTFGANSKDLSVSSLDRAGRNR